ncbi:YkoP family protein [Alicyclobacillus dauci]|uniref:YkoP family protein n=1 Tax=Alicyclobacillus dauci TaxID=1475485 RepID=UPI003899544C
MLSRISYPLWKSWDAIFRLVTQMKPLKRGESHLFFIKKRRYLGPPFSVDGVNVRPLDPVIELHMNNRLLAQVVRNQSSLVRTSIKLLKETKRSLPILADRIGSHAYQRTQVVYGITLIHRGVERFGFHVFPIDSKTVRTILTWYLHNIFRAFNPNANSILNKRPELFVPKVVVMSKKQLINSYHRSSGITSSQK